MVNDLEQLFELESYRYWAEHKDFMLDAFYRIPKKKIEYDITNIF